MKSLQQTFLDQLSMSMVQSVAARDSSRPSQSAVVLEPQSPEGKTWRKAFVGELLILFSLASLAVLLQGLGGAYQAEFGGHPDEAAHYVTGLMVHDYLASLAPAAPTQYASDYYVHYPKVAIGHWPPGFYVVEASWMFLFGESRNSVLLMMALITGLLSYTAYRIIRAQFGAVIGYGMAVLLIAFPLVQAFTSMVMIDTLIALLVLWAALAYGRYLEDPNWRWAVAFSLLASLAIHTKAAGWMLALLPGLCIVLSGRWVLMRRLSFWLPALIVPILCIPWYWTTRDMVGLGSASVEGTPQFRVLMLLQMVLDGIVATPGIMLTVIALVGLLVGLFRRRTASGIQTALLALLATVIVFLSTMPLVGIERRFLIIVVVPILYFLASGICWIAERLPVKLAWTEQRKYFVLCLVFVAFGLETFTVRIKSCHGFSDATQMLLSSPEFDHTVMLICSDEIGEGMFVSEVAKSEDRLGHILLRASKMLASSGWNGAQYELIHNSPAAMAEYLAKVPVGVVLVDTSVANDSQRVHHQRLTETIEAERDRWEIVRTYPVVRYQKTYPDALKIYRRIGQEDFTGQIDIRIDMKHSLQRTIEYHMPESQRKKSPRED